MSSRDHGIFLGRIRRCVGAPSKPVEGRIGEGDRAFRITTPSARFRISNVEIMPDTLEKNKVPDMMEEDSTKAEERLEKDVEILAARCARLEAQNILVSVQQLDLVARGTALSLSGVCLYLYWKWLSWTIEQLPSLVKSHLSAFIEEQGWIQVVMNPASLLVWKLALASIPYWRHSRMHGLDYRRFEVFAVAFIVIIRMKLTRWRERVFMTDSVSGIARFGEDTNEDAIWDANYEISARFLYVSILRLRGLWTKSAQYLSSRADFMPVSYVRELKKLQDEAPATEWDDVEKMLARAPGVLEGLTDVSKTPLASASIGQVHTARLKSTGEKVVLKVQHPHARSLLTDDFWSLAVISRIVTWMEPEYAFFEILMREWAVEARKELDFVAEADNLEAAQISIDKMLPDKTSLVYTNAMEACPDAVPFQVEIPRPVAGLCTRDALVMSFCEGVRIDDLEQIQQWNLPREAVMNAVAQTFAHMMYVTDLFNGDPHAGNLMIRPGTKASRSEGFTIVLLDWGLAKRLPEQKRLAFCQMVYAAATFDFGLLLDAFKTIGLKMKRENVAEDMEGMRFFLRDMAPNEKSRKRIKAKIRTDQKRMNSKKKGEKVPMEAKAYPGEFFFFVRVNELLHGLGSKLNVEMSYLDVLKPYAERGLSLSDYYSIKHAPPTFECRPLDVSLHAKVSQVLEELKEMKQIAGAQVCVIDDQGRRLTNNVEGHMGGLKCRTPMRPDALVLGYSCTKAVAASIAHLTVEDGYLTYDEPVSERVWRAFCPIEEYPRVLESALEFSPAQFSQQWNWKRSITLRHMLTHTSGMGSALPARMTIKTMASCEECFSAFEYNPEHPEEIILPSTEPGAKCEYHYMSFGWLVAGTLCGAYSLQHGKKSSTFEEVYEAILKPKLSQNTLQFGFRPCGGSGDFPSTDTETANITVSRVLQLQREAEAVGEDNAVDAGINSSLREMRDSFRGKEFLLDPRIWNCEEARVANVPAAGGRFSAMGLAHFYHDLGSGRIIGMDSLSSVTAVISLESAATELQGQTVMASTDTNVDGISLGMGYQLIRFDGDVASEPGAFGHAGVGGSIGFHHKRSGTSVGIMLNKADGDRDTAKTIVRAIADHYKW